METWPPGLRGGCGSRGGIERRPWELELEGHAAGEAEQAREGGVSPRRAVCPVAVRSSASVL